MALKGIQHDAPIFRLDGRLVDKDDLYWEVMTKLLNNEDKVEQIKGIIG